MKKILSILLVMVMMFSISVFATETTGTEQIENEEVISETVDTSVTKPVEEEKEQIYFKSKVIEASEVGEKIYINYYGQEVPVTGQDLKLRVQDGKYKGVEINLVFPLGDQGATEYDDPVKVGKTIYLYVTEQANQDGTTTYNGEIAMPIDSTREIVVIATIVALLLLIVLLSRLSSIRTIGVILLNIVILFVAFGILYFKEIPTIATLAIAAVLIILSNTLIINKFSKKTLVAIIGIMLATIITTGLCVLMINLTEVKDVFTITNPYTGEVIIDYLDLGIATIIIASIGVSINMAIKTVNEYVKGNGTINTIKTISADLVKCLNGVILVLVGTLLTNIFYIAYNDYPIHMMLFGENNAFMELLKVIVVVINPIIVIPITAVLSKILIQPTKGIDEAK